MIYWKSFGFLNSINVKVFKCKIGGLQIPMFCAIICTEVQFVCILTVINLVINMVWIHFESIDAYFEKVPNDSKIWTCNEYK